ncbi:phospholipase C [Scopulibacillus daqui]|uniref:Phospholipase C n=1 Tax=Scopulibacillus daqui TaxID=1469162 RepID=A0ABS2Q2W6_9BACL|nr:alkaline phosphatase family protein [Scopulibacillus daqui]MBM7646634.1 phospholipase C [Scopulibacillus daqui]
MTLRKAAFNSMLALSTLFAVPLTTSAHDNQANTKHMPPYAHVKHSEKTATPIQHVVVLFDENVSFDHYFGTYPHAKNPKGEPAFQAKPGTPRVYGLTKKLLTNNPNKYNPKRLDRSEAVTADMDHDYTDEQKAFDGGKMDKFAEYTSGGDDPSLVMDYYDGNTVTALWNYAQNFAMNDHSFGTTFGPSTPGALNLISGQTHGAAAYIHGAKTNKVKDYLANGTLFGDLDPYYDQASNPNKPTAALSGKNVGDLLNKKDITWGWFEGGFRNPHSQHKNIAGNQVADYSPHHEPFQYYQSTSNPKHLPPSSVNMIGKTDQANHQYDLKDFWSAADSGHLPAVSFLKASCYQDGHAGYSDPLDEQHFIVHTLNHLQSLPEWKNTAVIIAYDDSDGWYDHMMSPQVNGSNDPVYDALYGPGDARKPKLSSYLDRAGYGPRLPLLVISPYAKKNFVDHKVTDQSSILRFIEDNWHLGRIGSGSFDTKAGSLKNLFDFQQNPRQQKLYLDPISGQPITPAEVKGKS